MINLKLILILVPILFSCGELKNILNHSSLQDDKTTNESGVVITFDDNTVNDWYAVSEVLSFYDWKATFFVSNFNTLFETEILKLKSLKREGHEIAGHGFQHVNSVNYITENGKATYLNVEIYPMLNLMRENGLPITSFSYPFGSRNSSVDSILFNEFKILRSTTYGNPKPKSAECYYEKERLVRGLGLDGSYEHSSIPYFISLLAYAKKHNKIVVFYAHKPIPTLENIYQVEYKTLIEICKFVKSNNMKFYTFSELHNL